MELNQDSDEEMKKRLIEDDTSHGNISFIDGNDITIYLLVNPRSGSREGRWYTDLPKDQYSIYLESGEKTELNIINITIPDMVSEFK